jgi:hypothetical protein
LPTAIDIGGIEEIDTDLNGPFHRGIGILAIDRAKVATELPAAKTYLAYPNASLPKRSIFHKLTLRSLKGNDANPNSLAFHDFSAHCFKLRDVLR